MVIFGIVVGIFLVICSFYCFKRIKRKCDHKAVDCALDCIWAFCGCAFGGILLGNIISFGMGNYVVSSEFVLVETRSLEPIIFKNKEVFAIKNDQSYFYFTKSELSDCPLEVNSILLKEKDIRFGDIRTVNKYRIEPKGNLKWFFFSTHRRYSELFLLSKDDIL